VNRSPSHRTEDKHTTIRRSLLAVPASNLLMA
jgi:citrate lyase subunit beta / citryl-CoA lyase